jgi:nicotinamide-nucleotide amidase
LGLALSGPVSVDMAGAVAKAECRRTGATHALAVLIDLDEGADRMDFGGTICLAIADAEGIVSRQVRILGGREWLRLGAVELALDCLRRHLQGLPVTERSDFEKA